MKFDIPTIIAFCSLFISSATFLYTLLKVVFSFGMRLTAVETKADLFWQVAGKAISELIKHPNQIQKDQLMDKLINGSISNEELQELKVVLKGDLEEILQVHPIPSIENGKTVAYALALAKIEIMLFERGCKCEVKQNSKSQGLLQRLFG